LKASKHHGQTSPATLAGYARGRLSTQPRERATEGAPVPGRHPIGLGRERDGALFIPAGVPRGAALPLVVALHGAGGVAAQMLDLLQPEAQQHQVALLAPEARDATWDAIRNGYGPDVAFIDLALAATVARVAIDPGRIALAGFSDGASYALSLGLANGDLFSDILAFSPGFMAPPGQEGRPRIFISHGRADKVLPIDHCSRRLVPALEGAGYSLDYVEFAGGHVVPAAMIERAFAQFLGR
jgi:phospholipase/carboxylesterase